MTAGAPSETTTDGFLGGRVTLIQPRRGHRAGLDAALLQACAPGDATGLAVDLGAGVGPVAFALAARAPALEVAGIERDTTVLALARAALLLPANASFAARLRLIEADVAAPGGIAGLPSGAADWALMNPPFDDPGRASASPHAGKRSAYLAEPADLEAWLAEAARLLRPAGKLCVIHRPAALPQLLARLQHGFGDIRILPVQPRQDARAKRVLIRAKRASRAAPTLCPALILHESDGRWTEQAARILAGEAVLSF